MKVFCDDEHWKKHFAHLPHAERTGGPVQEEINSATEVGKILTEHFGDEQPKALEPELVVQLMMRAYEAGWFKREEYIE